MLRILRYACESNVLLAQNPLHAHAANYALSIYPSDAVYSFIPKNACSTMRYSIALAHGAIEGPSQFNWIHSNNQTFRASLRELTRCRYAFVILRDPFLRLASCFLDKFVGQTPVAHKFQALLDFPGSQFDLTFRGFVARLKPHLRTDEHWRPQVDFLVYRSYDDVFCLEDFDTAVRTLNKKIGFEVCDARDLSKHGVDRYQSLPEGDCAADFNAFQLLSLKRQGKAPALRSFYDEKLAKRVSDLYAEDLALYRDWCGRDAIF